MEAAAEAVKVALVLEQKTLSASLLEILTDGSVANAATVPPIEKSGEVEAFALNM